MFKNLLIYSFGCAHCGGSNRRRAASNPRCLGRALTRAWARRRRAGLITFGSWQPSAARQFAAPLVVTIVLTNAAAGLCVSLVLKYCDSLVKGFSTSVSVGRTRLQPQSHTVAASVAHG